MRRRRGRQRAHPTVFDGIQFRSRLEARWAAFFRILGWDFTYEPPLDLKSYIPDFAILDGIAECKPYLRPSDNIVNEAITKIKESGYEGEALILGARIWADTLGRSVVGISNEVNGVYLPFHLTRSNGHWLLCTCETGCVETKYDRTNHAWVNYCWRDAGNRVQWKKPKGIL